MNKDVQFAKIPLDKIITTKSQARQQNVDRNLEDLATSIELHGLFSPVLAVRQNDGTYELIAGQRRMLACRRYLQPKYPERFSEIPAHVYDDLKEWEKTAISINDNLNQEPLTEADKIAAVTVCYNKFGNSTTVSEKTGIPYRKVLQYVRYERLPAVLRDMCDDGTVKLKDALDTADLFGLDSSDIKDNSEEEIKIAALEMKKLTSNQRINARKIRKEDKQASPSNAISTVRSSKSVTKKITTEVAAKTYARIESYKTKNDIASMEIAASELIEEGMADRAVC